VENLSWLREGKSLIGKYQGEITMEITQDFKQQVEKTLEREQADFLILDLSEVSFMDSSGIGFLVACNTRMQSSGKALVLYRPSSQVRKTLGLVQLMSHFDVADTQDELSLRLGV
jgi:anti-sigma B factor antagonist